MTAPSAGPASPGGPGDPAVVVLSARHGADDKGTQPGDHEAGRPPALRIAALVRHGAAGRDGSTSPPPGPDWPAKRRDTADVRDPVGLVPNVRAAGRCSIRLGGSDYHAVGPEWRRRAGQEWSARRTARSSAPCSGCSASGSTCCSSGHVRQLTPIPRPWSGSAGKAAISRRRSPRRGCHRRAASDSASRSSMIFCIVVLAPAARFRAGPGAGEVVHHCPQEAARAGHDDQLGPVLGHLPSPPPALPTLQGS